MTKNHLNDHHDVHHQRVIIIIVYYVYIDGTPICAGRTQLRWTFCHLVIMRQLMVALGSKECLAKWEIGQWNSSTISLIIQRWV